MTELQKVEFELLKSVIGICEELNIRYFLVCGTALGAVKYHGFIPWDDDCDVAMLREDYERFISEAPPKLHQHYFLQNYYTEDPCPRIFSKLRDSRTTYIESTASELNINHGVAIDIFPLDDYPLKKLQQFALELRKWIYTRQISCVYREKRTGASLVLWRMNRILGYGKKTNERVRRLERSLTDFRCEKSGLLCNHGNWQGKLEYVPREQYGEGTWADFEGLRVRIPEKYDEYLTQKYGDWRADLPPEQQVSHHKTEIIDLTRPYMDYLARTAKARVR